eukprot:2191041-Pyramimonas_sp.AAC.1
MGRRRASTDSRISARGAACFGDDAPVALQVDISDHLRSSVQSRRPSASAIVRSAKQQPRCRARRGRACYCHGRIGGTAGGERILLFLLFQQVRAAR